MRYRGRPIYPSTKPEDNKTAYRRFKDNIFRSAANDSDHNLISGLAALGIAGSSGLVAAVRQARYNKRNNSLLTQSLLTQGERLIDEHPELIAAIDRDDNINMHDIVPELTDDKESVPPSGATSGVAGKRKSKKKLNKFKTSRFPDCNEKNDWEI